VDLAKLDRFSSMWLNFMSHQNNALEFLLVSIEQLNTLFKAKKITFFVTDKRLQQRMIKKQTVSHGMVRVQQAEISQLTLEQFPMVGVSKDNEHTCLPPLFKSNL
jgi:hypothetical protein